MGYRVMASDIINISHEQFNEFTGSVFNILYSAHEFTDVTLVCDEDKQIEAHKVILSSSSKLFRRILIKNRHKHPLIYLNGVSYEILQSIVQFLYIGQVDISKDHLPLFIKTAGELEVNGLDSSIHATNSFNDSGNNRGDVGIKDILENNFMDEQNEIESEENTLETKVLQSPKELGDNTLKSKLISFQCSQCTNTFTTKSDVKKHTRIVHEGLSYPFTNAERTRRWKERKRSKFPEDIFQEMQKLENQKRNMELKTKRLIDKDFDDRFKRENRERKRRLREKKSLEEALAERLRDM